MIALYWIPESPRYLMMKDRIEDARDILLRLHDDATDPQHEFARAEMYQIQKQISIDRTLGSSWIHIFRKKSYLKRVGMACVRTLIVALWNLEAAADCCCRA